MNEEIKKKLARVMAWQARVELAKLELDQVTLSGGGITEVDAVEAKLVHREAMVALCTSKLDDIVSASYADL